MKKITQRVLLVICLFVFASAIMHNANNIFDYKIPSYFPKPQIPEDNLPSQERINLGKKLFFDKKLSLNKSIACSSCHAPNRGFSDSKKFSLGVNDSIGERNAMPLFNLAWQNSFFWDGGVPTLELQVLKPLTNSKEMNISIEEVVGRLKKDKEYVSLFKKAYGCKPDANSLSRAIACYERTLISANSKYDKFYYQKKPVMSDSEIRGMFLFHGSKTHCSSCHSGVNFTNNAFENNALYENYTDQGRYKITGKESDKGKFKVPSLRNVAVTAPYMHDGSLQTLEEVVEHYASGGKNHPNRSGHVHNNDAPALTASEKVDLINFLKCLTDEEFLSNTQHIP